MIHLNYTFYVTKENYLKLKHFMLLQMMETKIENPWDVKSIYEYYHFNCPTCSYKHTSKQDFVNHVANIHPESVDYLKNLSDGSLCDIETPWKSSESEYNNFMVIVKKELVEDKTVSKNHSEQQDADYYPSQFLETHFENPKWDLNDLDNEYYNAEDLKTESMDNGNNNASRIKKHRCNHCEKPKYFSSKKVLERHILTVHDDMKPYKCDLCEMAYGQSGYLNQHKRKAHDNNFKKEVSFEDCKICGKTIKACFMPRHIKQSHEENRPKINWKCEYCGKEYGFRSKLQAHVSVAHEGKKFQCKECDNKYRSLKGLSDHMASVHQGIEYMCQTCGVTHKNIQSYKEHMLKHDGTNKFQCSLCGKEFVAARQLRVHNDLKHNEKKHVCSICGAAYAKKYLLNKHESLQHLHKGEKNFQCHYCEKSYSRSNVLTFHIICAHEPHRKIKCPECDRKFVYKSRLDAHLKNLCGSVKNHKCPKCDKLFPDEKNIKRHIDSVHLKLKPYKCDECEVAYGQSGDLKRHKIRAHQNVTK